MMEELGTCPYCHGRIRSHRTLTSTVECPCTRIQCIPTRDDGVTWEEKEVLQSKVADAHKALVEKRSK